MKVENIAKEIGMTESEILLFKKILRLINDKENGMYESVQKELDRFIHEEVQNDSE